MKIMTLNINSIRAHAESFIDILRGGEYDVIMVQELKVEDASRHCRLHPGETGYTWYGYRGRDTVGNNQGLRLDYFMANRVAEKMITNCEIDMSPRLAEKPTDHCGLVIKLK